jgi:SPP1 family predicted phage head-tail adaptor
MLVEVVVMPLVIGTLNQRVTFQAPLQTPDGLGGFNVTWQNMFTTWAAIWPISAKERITSNVTDITHRIRIRYKAGIKSDWRIQFGSVYFSLIGSPIDYRMQHLYLDMTCKESA